MAETATDAPARDPVAVLEEIRQRADAAVPGPWEHPKDYDITHGYHIKDGFHVATWIATVDAGDSDIGEEQAHANAEFIAAARSDIPRLLAMSDALLKLAGELEAKSAALWEQIAATPEAETAGPALRASAASAYRNAATGIREAVAAALSGEETPAS